MLKHNNYNGFDIKKLDKNKLINYVKDFSKLKALVLGDLILDEYLLGKPERISREAPVIILKYIRSNFALGGASNAANNIAALGASCTLIGVTGDDASARTFENITKENQINLIRVVDSQRETTTKTRVISTSSSNPDSGTVLKQQVLRVDRENRNDINQNLEKQLLKAFQEQVSANDMVLLSDYNNGVFTSNIAKETINKSKDAGKKSIVDSNGDFSKFKGAYSLTPNQPDLEKLIKREIAGEADLVKASEELIEMLNIEELLVTRGAKGMALVSAKKTTNFIPALNLSEVFDVTGAGDTVAATYSLGLAAGASPFEAALLGNLAASIVVRKYGTATVNQDELIELIAEIS